MKIEEIILNLINTYDCEDIDLCYYIFDSLKMLDVQEAAIGLRVFCENISYGKSNKTLKLEKHVSKEETEQCYDTYEEYIDGMLKIFVKESHIRGETVSVFYEKLWDMMINNFAFDGDKVYSFVLFKFIENPLLPYFNLSNPMQMDNDRFSAIIQNQKMSILKIKHILEINFSQKTEYSSLILEELLKIKNFEQQTVFLAVILDALRKKELNNLWKFMQSQEYSQINSYIVGK